MSSNSHNSRQQQTAQRKLVIRRRKRRIGLTLSILLVVVALGLSGWWLFNHNTAQKVQAQYETADAQRFLKTNASKGTLRQLQQAQGLFGWLWRPAVAQQVQQFQKDFNQRRQHDQRLAQLLDGKAYYRNTVSAQVLSRLDQALLQEKNQTVYQRQKNRLDTVQVWFAQTQDGNQFIDQAYQTFQKDQSQLTQEQVAEANVYYKLLKNRQIKARWQTPIQTMTAAFSQLQKEKSAQQQAADAQALADLKNAPLTQSYTPAKVTISDGTTKDSTSSASPTSDADLTKALKAAGVDASRLLVLDTQANQVFLAQRSGDSYTASGSRYSLLSNGLSTGTYTVKALIQSASGYVVTDPNSSDFGSYHSDNTATDQRPNNTTSDFNAATPVFWLKNQPALSSALLVANATNIGFLTPGSVTSDHVSRISASTMSALFSTVSAGTVVCVI
ncbi:hypothetical protein FC83_GL002864 [Agrilactobacillus composti DSM 18527 = JCM 14202]|uniref:Uncharacterized protein n=1 Tax=Agrilactobacillus composti DSM 18527 = JCM 14202 TaxID=1423734 RepID=X0PFY5_9LACO|nr:hypothetical protein [Agrilactobacillus composti]KRM33297.1 hypothetical protein FC83_GL002864 [Agrilactobacillus composti DSM 18527 = JCM 14202]GAF40733.1 hypothetical protein JCM14202_2639 [Agrilactobacillus composti DSM 18527 = JCM 14202]